MARKIKKESKKIVRDVQLEQVDSHTKDKVKMEDNEIENKDQPNIIQLKVLYNKLLLS